jgi:N utilization substance protein B
LKSARRRSREGLVQGLYQWLLTGHEPQVIQANIMAQEHLARADQAFFSATLPAVIAESAQLDQQLQPWLDREASALSPVERAILWLATFELLHHPETPFRVIINEAVELAKLYGGTDGHKYVNGVLDKLAANLRPGEAQAKRQGRA